MRFLQFLVLTFMISYSYSKDIVTDYAYYEADNAPYRFSSMDDVEAHKYFNENGYVVITDMFENQEEIEYAHKLLWNYLETVGWKKDNPLTWNNFPGCDITGIIYQNGIGQSGFQWFIRTRKKILSTFEKIWNLTQNDNDNKLITSYDGIGIFRPWKYNKRWETFDGWYHIDQNIVNKPGLDAIQGVLSLTNQNNLTGSTVVIPRSHLFTPTYLADTMTADDGDFNVINENDVDILLKPPHNLFPLLLSTKSGDLLLWDARLIHCSSPSLELLNWNMEENYKSNTKEIELLRVVSYVCMTPKYKASPEMLKKRINGFETHQTSNHNPHDIHLYGKHDQIPALWRDAQKLDMDIQKR